MKLFIFGAAVLGALLFVGASVLGAEQIEGYSMIAQYISESYAAGLPNTQYLRYLYIASGIFFALFAVMAPYEMPKSKGVKIGFFLFAIFYGLGTVTTGFFPCDIGCNPDPEIASLSQFIHNTVGFLVYATVPFCLIGIGFLSKKIIGPTKFSKTSLLCGAIAICFVVLLSGNPTGPFVGLFQRIIEGSILFWVVFTGYTIQTK